MANTLFIVKDEVFGALPDAVKSSLLLEVKKIFSFIPHFTVEARTPALFPATLHFTDSVVKVVPGDDDVTGAINDMRRQEDSNVRFSIKQTGIHLTLNPLPLSPGGDPDQGGIGGQWKTTAVEGGGKTISITMTYGVASLESAEQAVVDEVLHGRTLEDIRKDRRQAIAKKGLGYYGKAESLKSTREEMEIELIANHTPLQNWPRDQTDSVAIALARMVAHEARHQYVQPHSAKGLGADSPRVWGDKNFEKFDGADQANILTAIHQFNAQWSHASIHLETCPAGQPSPFA